MVAVKPPAEPDAEAYGPKARWRFDDVALARGAGRFHANLSGPRLLHASMACSLWNPHQRRGGDSAALAVLTLAALHAAVAAPEEARGDQRGHTTPTALSIGRMAAVTGSCPERVMESLDFMCTQGLVVTRKAPRKTGRGLELRVGVVRMLFSRAEDWKRGEVVRIPWELFYAGHLASLPTPAARQLLLTIGAQQMVRSPEHYVAGIAAGGEIEPADAAALLTVNREDNPVSLPSLGEMCGGLSRSPLYAALRVLQAPALDGGTVPYVETGAPTFPTWIGWTPGAFRKPTAFPFEMLNEGGGGELRARQAQVFGGARPVLQTESSPSDRLWSFKPNRNSLRPNLVVLQTDRVSSYCVVFEFLNSGGASDKVYVVEGGAGERDSSAASAQLSTPHPPAGKQQAAAVAGVVGTLSSAGPVHQVDHVRPSKIRARPAPSRVGLTLPFAAGGLCPGFPDAAGFCVPISWTQTRKPNHSRRGARHLHASQGAS
ncbi:MAG: hypothetical protein JWM27_101 [Gemmatimonadetes bacterium]|nr:hypothetical protein [Gemmatimonadota bacterium]